MRIGPEMVFVGYIKTILSIFVVIGVSMNTLKSITLQKVSPPWCKSAVLVDLVTIPHPKNGNVKNKAMSSN